MFNSRDSKAIVSFRTLFGRCFKIITFAISYKFTINDTNFGKLSLFKIESELINVHVSDDHTLGSRFYILSFRCIRLCITSFKYAPPLRPQRSLVFHRMWIEDSLLRGSNDSIVSQNGFQAHHNILQELVCYLLSEGHQYLRWKTIPK